MDVVRHTLRLRVQDPVHVLRSGLQRDRPSDPKPGEVYFATDTLILWLSDTPGKWTGVEFGH